MPKHPLLPVIDAKDTLQNTSSETVNILWLDILFE